MNKLRLFVRKFCSFFIDERCILVGIHFSVNRLVDMLIRVTINQKLPLFMEESEGDKNILFGYFRMPTANI